MKFKPGDLCKTVTSWYFKNHPNTKQRFFPLKESESIGMIISIDKESHKVQIFTIKSELKVIHEQCLLEKIK